MKGFNRAGPDWSTGSQFPHFKKLKVTLGPLFPSFLRTKGGTFRGASFLSADPPCTRATHRFASERRGPGGLEPV